MSLPPISSSFGYDWLFHRDYTTAVTAQAISVLCISTATATNRAGLCLVSDSSYTPAPAGKAGEPGKRLNPRALTGAAGNMGFGYHHHALSPTDAAIGEGRQDAKGVSAHSLAKATFYLNHLLLNGRLFVCCSSSACHLGHLLLCISVLLL